MTLDFRTSLVPVLVCLFATVAACRDKAAGQGPSGQLPVTASPSGEGDTAARPRIVALGDSLTAGLGLLERQAYPALLQQKVDAEGYPFEVINAGVSGDTTAGGLRRLDWALEGDVRILIVALGANDGLRGLSVGEMKKNLDAIIERAKQKQILVILAGMEAPPNYGAEYTGAFRQAFQDVARRHQVLFLPFLLVRVAGDPSLNQGDGIHPNTRGAAIIAESVWEVLRPVLDRMSVDS